MIKKVSGHGIADRRGGGVRAPRPAANPEGGQDSSALGKEVKFEEVSPKPPFAITSGYPFVTDKKSSAEGKVAAYKKAVESVEPSLGTVMENAAKIPGGGTAERPAGARHRARWPPAHQHLPGALGEAEVQVAQVIQTGQALVARPAAQAACHVRSLGLDDRILNGSDETSGVTGDCHAPSCGSRG